MKQKTVIIINCIISCIILFGVFGILLLDGRNFERLVEDDIENISKLSARTIYGEINRSLTEPVFVARTMSEDVLLKNWLKEETEKGAGGEEQLQVMKDYLSAYREKYEYDSVYLISAKSNIYYHYKGINKTVSPQDEHDDWYYDFVDSDRDYKLNIDTDEANENKMTVFVDCRMKDANGKLLGVVGVGLKMSHLQMMLQDFEEEYNLQAIMIDSNGTIMAASDSGKIETDDFSDNPVNAALEEQILANRESMKIYWYPDQGVNNCVISQYIPNLDWYLVIEKDNQPVHRLLTRQFHRDLLVVLFIIALVLFMVAFIVNRYNRLLYKTASTDEVTGLPNSKMFFEMYRRNTKRESCRSGSFFLFDVDNFKIINDSYGHLHGNTVLYKVSAIAREIIGSRGIVGRFGGDEFVGVVYAPPQEADALLERLVTSVNNQGEELKGINISLGVTRINPGSKRVILIREADAAMYRAKTGGMDKIKHYHETGE